MVSHSFVEAGNHGAGHLEARAAHYHHGARVEKHPGPAWYLALGEHGVELICGIHEKKFRGQDTPQTT